MSEASTPATMDLDQAIERARLLAARPGRHLLGIVGPPGAGKSTLARVLGDAIGTDGILVPMDGFHLADVELARLDRSDRKGAPDTFDAHGYLCLLERLRHPRPGVTVYAPAFERELEQPIAGSIAVAPEIPLVITEGNYLLLDDAPWPAVRDLVHEIWWVDSDPALRHDRLVARHIRFGKEPGTAESFVTNVDEANAQRLASGRAHADRIVSPLPTLPTPSE